MADDQNEPGKSEAPKEKEAQDLPLTSQDFIAALDKLVERAKAAGVRPLQVMAATYAKKSMDILDSFLGALEEGDGKKKRKKK